MITRSRLWWTFFWLGCTGFGGGVAVLAQIYTLVVIKHHWMTEPEYWEAAALGQSLPGSAAANAIGYIGLRLNGDIGATIAVTAFVLPSFILMLGLTMIYRAFHQIPNINAIFMGMNAAIVGVVLAVSIKMGQRVLITRPRWLIAILSCLALVTNIASILEVVLFAGLCEILLDSLARAKGQPTKVQATNKTDGKSIIMPPERKKEISKTDLSKDISKDISRDVSKDVSKADNLGMLLPIGFKPMLGVYIATLPVLAHLAIVFLRVGAITFGGGFVMIPLIEQEVVKNTHWLNHQEFVDGMALGQITPGPVIITATFVGYYVHGFLGALIATVAVFLPPFVMTVIAGHSLEHMRKNPQLKAFLQGISPAVVGMMVAAFINIAQLGIHNYIGVILMIVSCIILLRWRITPAIVMIAAAIVGLVVQKIG